MKVYQVVGCFRKELLGLKPVDIDYVVSDNGNATANNLQHARLRVIRKFKKITVKFLGEVEFRSKRTFL